KVFFIFGENKIMPTLDEAVARARNVASPKNAAFLECKTPCAVKGEKCFDCKSPDRICNAMVIYMHAMEGTEMEAVVIGEPHGF
ncbi:MAG: LUD domain-containing protein, partial [Firmicutes bacterium]|nr:LUD domain-containing protein [Bacillota bacterium]